MVAGADRDSLPVERLADVLRPAAVKDERDDARPLAGRADKPDPRDASQARHRLFDQLVLVGRDRLEPDRVEMSIAAPRPTASAMLPVPASNRSGGA